MLLKPDNKLCKQHIMLFKQAINISQHTEPKQNFDINQCYTSVEQVLLVWSLFYILFAMPMVNKQQFF